MSKENFLNKTTSLLTPLTLSFDETERNDDKPLIKSVSGFFDKILNLSKFLSFKSLAKKV